MTVSSHRFIFILTYGRSGSTLLSGYINSLPGFCMRGENHMALAGLYDFYQSIELSLGQKSLKSGSPTHPWYGIDNIDLAEVRQGVKELFVNTVLKPDAEHHTIGCKEIRLQRRDLADLDGFLEGLMSIFGDVKFLFNHRRFEDTAKSKWWRETAHSHAIIRAMDNRLQTSRYTSASNVFHVQYEELVNNVDHARQLTEFIGASFDERIYREVLAVRHAHW